MHPRRRILVPRAQPIRCHPHDWQHAYPSTRAPTGPRTGVRCRKDRQCVPVYIAHVAIHRFESKTAWSGQRICATTRRCRRHAPSGRFRPCMEASIARVGQRRIASCASCPACVFSTRPFHHRTLLSCACTRDAHTQTIGKSALQVVRYPLFTYICPCDSDAAHHDYGRRCPHYSA